MGGGLIGNVRLRELSDDVIERKSGEHVGIRSSARKPLVHAAIGLASVTMAGGAVAQEALPTIDVSGQSSGGQGESPANTLQAQTGLGRLPGTVQDIPQTVQVITQETIRQQGATTLDQALRYVPGVTVNTGEGGGGMQGDQFRIRGFQAKADIYSDGLRDFGVYVRDSFAFEQIQVFKGPTSESFGMGTTGGAINYTQKTAKLGNFADLEGTAGTGPMGRGVFDINRQLDATTAVRIVGMVHDQDIVDRDHVFSDRWGVLGSVGFGLGTSTSLTVNYLHQSGHRQPDFGVPSVTPTGRIGLPITEFGVPRSNYYGKASDNDHHDVDMFTARFKSDVNSWLTVTNDSRLAFYGRDFTQSVPGGVTGNNANAIAGGNFNIPYTPGGPAGFLQDAKGAENVTTAIAKFHTGFLRHEFIAGVDLFYQSDDRVLKANQGTKTGGTYGNPFFPQVGYTVYNNYATGKRVSDSTNIGLFASDRVWFTDQFSLLGGVRWDRYDVHSATNAAGGVFTAANTFDATTEFVSPKASAIWEPTKEQTYYVSWARSYSNLAGQYITNELNPVTIDTKSLQPEESNLYEAGLKWSLLGGKLGFTTAVFRVDKSNSVQRDPNTGDIVLPSGSGGEGQRVQGVEVGLTGKITDLWDVQAAYAYYDSEITSSGVTGDIGHRVSFVPENSVSLWTTYNVAPLMNIQGKLLVGGGIIYADGFYGNSANSIWIPETFTVNGLISYEYQKYRLALNVYNITDELYYDASIGTRSIPTAGRTVMLTGGVKW